MYFLFWDFLVPTKSHLEKCFYVKGIQDKNSAQFFITFLLITDSDIPSISRYESYCPEDFLWFSSIHTRGVSGVSSHSFWKNRRQHRAVDRLISMRLISKLETSFDMALFKYFWRFAQIYKKRAAYERKIVFLIVSEQF